MNTAKPEQDAENEHIDFNLDVTPFITPENDVQDDTQLQQHQQHVADGIQLQLTGAIASNTNNNQPLLVDDEIEQHGNRVQTIFARLTGNNSWVIVLMVHGLVIALALIFGRADISGLADIPLEQKVEKPLPPLKSYLITETEYNKLVERAQQAEHLNTEQQDIGVRDEPTEETTMGEVSDKQAQ
ncbi:hypothetical protein ACROAE_15130 [Shewanella sp. MF05960]|uniref:hypothetical protein n=1 Tax=Shewanella sp. MF05960 TaxID=3434874 RepID=UPI003D7B6926